MQAPMPPSFSPGQDAPPLAAGDGTVASRQQKMLRQRQLALKRQRDLCKGTSGVVVQHEVPLAGPSQSSKKAFQFLVELPRPASCNEKVPPTSVKVVVSAETAEGGEKLSAAGDDRLPLPAAAQAAPEGTDGKAASNVNLLISDLDSESGTFNFNLEALAADIEGESRALRQDTSGKLELDDHTGPKEKGWDLDVQTDDLLAVAPSANEKSRGSKLWRPWKKAAAPPKTVAISAEEPTCVSSFGDRDPLEESFDNRSVFGVNPLSRAATPWPASETQLDGLDDSEGLPGAMHLLETVGLE